MIQRPFDLTPVFTAIQNRPDLSDSFFRVLEVQVPIDLQKYGIVLVRNFSDDQQFTAFTLQIPRLLSFFSPHTLQRNHLQQIIVSETYWFKKGATYENLNTRFRKRGPLTNIPKARASMFSLPCGQAKFVLNDPLNVYESEVVMYDFPSCLDASVVGIYQSYTFLHEIAHTYAKSAYHWQHYVNTIKRQKDYTGCAYLLQLPDGRTVDGEQYVEDFNALIDAYGPFGSYSAGYTSGYLKLHEGFADASAAYFMGFMMYPELQFPCLPQEVEKYLFDFYHATAIIDR